MNVPTTEEVVKAILSSKKGHSPTSPDQIRDNIHKHQIEKENDSIALPDTDFCGTAIIKVNELMGTPYVFVTYIREEKTIMKQTGDDGSINLSIVPGKPVACLVAFMDGLGLRIGWSLRNNSKRPLVQNVRGEVIKWGNVEPLPYIKKQGIKVALLRAITDKIHIETARVYETKTTGVSQESMQIGKHVICFEDSGKRIHNVVSNALPKFIKRCQLWFQQNNHRVPVNVSYMDTVKNVEVKNEWNTT